MSKKSKRKFNRSQAAHRRLAKKHVVAANAAKKTGKYRLFDVHSRKSCYHNEAISKQKRLGRILSSEEKTSTFNKIFSSPGKVIGLEKALCCARRKSFRKKSQPISREKYFEIMRQDFPKDFVD